MHFDINFTYGLDTKHFFNCNGLDSMITTQRINWKSRQAKIGNLLSAIELSVEYARVKNNLSVERIAELMGIPSHWTLYKYMESGKLPANLIPTFEHVCGCSFVSEFLATRAGKIVIDIPRGKKATSKDINLLQQNFTRAIDALLDFYEHQGNEAETIGNINAVIADLAAHRSNVAMSSNPELCLFGGEE